MAVLGNLRKNSFVLIAVIGMALFAFVIAGVFDGSGFQSQEPIGIVNGEELSVTDFRNQIDVLKKSYNFNDLQALTTAWDETVRSKLLSQQIDELGIGSSRDHLEFFLSQSPSFNSDERFLNDAGIFDVNKFSNFIAELKEINPQSYSQWSLQEEQFNKQIKFNSYFNLVTSGFNSTFFEGKNQYLKSNNIADISFVKIPYSTVNDSLISVSSSEIRSYIKDNPADFDQKSVRSFDYVIFNESPSVKDETDLRNKINSLLNEREEYNQVSKLNEVIPGFLTTSNLDFFLSENSDVPYDSIYRPKGYFSSSHAQMIFNLENNNTYGPYVDGDFLKISKMLDKKRNGNVRASHILIAYNGSQGSNPQITRTKNEAKNEANRILKLARSNPDNFSSYAIDFSDGPSKSNGGDLGFFQEGNMVKPFNDFVFNNRVGRIGLVETDFGYHVIKIVAKEDVVLVGTLALKNIPSERTSDSIFNIASKFEIELSNIGDFNQTAESFDFEVKSLNNIGVLDHDLPNMENQRRLVQWLFNEETEIDDFKRFDLSRGGYVIAKLTDKAEEGLMKPELASITVLPILKNKKKAKIIISDNKKFKNLEDLASNNNLEILNVSALNQVTPIVAQAGFEPKVIGKAFGLEINSISDLFEGETGVYMIKLNSIKSADELESYTPFENQLTNKFRSNIDFSIVQSLKKSADISDNRNDYY
ncbi:MAG: peptidylprolyl isomerase [Flavobacteriaceae bacterium]|jgi:peptidyl-prolyl cis-trans isomerase D|tara:strand:+ start:2245 stop:4353 length:2109 start_codon:yes stop_codon:yes gene_type:complete